MLGKITGNDKDTEYFGLHTAGFGVGVGVAFQVFTTDGTICIKFIKSKLTLSR